MIQSNRAPSHSRWLNALAVLVALAAVVALAQGPGAPGKPVVTAPGADFTAPTVTITVPTTAATYDAGTDATLATLSGTASDATSVSSCTWVNDLGGSGNATGTTSWSVSSIALTVGDNAITVTCVDPGGNQGTDVITVTRISSTVLLTETFEDTSWAARGWSDIGNTPPVSTVEKFNGTASLECQWTSAATNCSGGYQMRHAITATETLYVAYYVKHSANFVGSSLAYHPHLWYFQSDLDGATDGPAFNWLNYYVENIYENNGAIRLAFQDGKMIDLANIGVDLVGVTEDRAIAGCNGDSDGYGDDPDPNVDCYDVGGGVYWNSKRHDTASGLFNSTAGSANYKGNWHLVETYLAMNSINAGVGVADGTLQIWYDGTQVLNRTNVLMRTGQNPTIKLDQVLWAPYIGDGSPATQTMWFDDLLVATGRPSTPPTPPMTCTHCFFETSFTTDEGWTADRFHNGGACSGNGLGGGSDTTNPSFQAGINQGLNDAATGGGCTSVTTAANYSGGRGGRGNSFYVSDTQVNDVSGALVYTFANMPNFVGTTTNELWARMYVQYEAGIGMFNSSGHKTVYFTGANCGAGVAGCYTLFEGSDDMRLTRAGNNFYGLLANYGFANLMGGTNSSDGQWHLFEYHWKSESSGTAADGEVEWWLDGTLRFADYTVDYNNFGSGFAGFNLPENGFFITPQNPAYIRYDDIALSTVQRIGGF